ncbi:helix-turn-helix transcriptional regulator [Clostridium sp. CCUG 7971]|uniref:helix-turn-helix domain-containing protein n=1 Tax=Clostridium sp. CCUG 7971 TaxID=2811414 RepID=UPI001ABADFC6|nr:helix-turn-helix transcriptional regulator [Clostridium sp. CCUG 7971]MBO3444944.1 helix-turn-helix transcriptional regulator [Clostridium sp. CCUG 7971]
MEKLKIGESIKSLRRNKNVTQEQLANIIGVSTPAVSKWESGTSYPDITVLPILANYFEVTIDELLNYKNELTKEEIEEIFKKCEDLISQEKIDESINLCEKYIRKYPSNYELKFNLSAIYTLAAVRSIAGSDKYNDILSRNIEILLDIVDNTNDIKEKEGSLIQLSSQYMLIDKPDKAEEILKKIYKPTYDPQGMLSIIYLSQGKVEESKKLMQEILYNALIEAKTSCMSLAMSYYNYKDYMDEEDIDFEKAKKYYELALGIEKSTSEMNMTHTIYSQLAHMYMKKKDSKSSIRCLRKMLDYLKDVNINDRMKINDIWCFDKMEEKAIKMKTNLYEHIIVSLKEGFSDFIGNKEFEEIIEELEVLSEKIKFKTRGSDVIY